MSLPGRQDFLLDPEALYLNHASFGATPRLVLAAQRALQDELEAQPMAFYDGLMPRLRAAMQPVAATLGAPVDDLVFVDNASTGVSAVLRSLRLGPGDALLTTSHAYLAVAKALDWVVARTGCTLRVAHVPWPVHDAQQIVDAVQQAWRDDVRVAVLDHVASVSAIRFPVERLVPWLQARGTRVLLDGAHVPGQVPVDLTALGADWWTGNLHKWAFTPKGCGVLYAADGAELSPLVLSLHLDQGFAPAFEKQGTRDPTAWLAAPAAWAFVEQAGGWSTVQAHNDRCVRALAERVEAELGLPWMAPSELLHHMVPLQLVGVEPTTAAAGAFVRRVWERHRVQLWANVLAGRVVLRLSGQVYLSASDGDRLITALRSEL